MKLYNQFNKDCESFRNFDDAIKYDSTRRSYHYYLNELMRFANLEDYDDLAKLETDEIQKLLENWVREQKKKDLISNTISTKLNGAELFFDMNKKNWYRKIVRKMLPDNDRIPGGDVSFTTEDVLKIKQAAKKPRDIAVIDFLACTGVRPGCLSDPVLQLKHLEDMPHGCKAIKVYDDSREGYWAFLTPEATQSLDKYLNWRKFNHEELTEESVLFKTYDNPNTKKDYLTADSVREMLVNLIKLAGIERKKTKNRYDKSIVYGFRKRFNGILKMHPDVNSNIAEKLMGHKHGLDGNYLKPTKEQCFTEFIKAIPELTISNEARDKAKIASLEQEKSQIQQLKEQVKQVRTEIEYEVKNRAAITNYYATGDVEGLKGVDPDLIEFWGYWGALIASGKLPKTFVTSKQKLLEISKDYPLLAKTIGKNGEKLPLSKVRLKSTLRNISFSQTGLMLNMMVGDFLQ